MKTKVAMLYDFDKTLSTKDMQEFGFIESVESDPEKFWGEVQKFSQQNNMDSILSYMYMMMKTAKQQNKPLRKDGFKPYAEDIDYYPGVLDWFERINKYADSLGLEVEHYIISSGIQEIVENSVIAHNFKKIYACKYVYDENGEAIWPGLVVNYTTKTQYIFRVNKQVLDVHEDNELNRYIQWDSRPIPFERMMYLGDGLTDVPCMRLVKEYGGKSIVIYNEENERAVQTARELMNDHRVNYMCKADYTPNSDIEKLCFMILEKMAIEARLQELDGKIER